MESIVARKMHRTLEPFHGMIYFSPEAAREYRELGSERDRSGYFASRAAPMGAVRAEVVTATFFNFNPDLVNESMAGVWEVAEPTTWIEAQLRAADAALTTYLGKEVDSPEMTRAAQLARTAADSCWPAGRPLAAGLLDLEWPEPAHLALWRAISITREFRGDGHVAVLVASNLTPIEALVLHAGTGEVSAAALRATRAWPEEEWNRALSDLQGRSLVDEDGRLTESGQAFREDMEARTDLAAMPPWEALGQDGCDELRGLVRPYSKTLVTGGAFGFIAEP
jgi:hypothetical protein